MVATQETRKSRPPEKRNPNINWGTIIITKNGIEFNAMWSFQNQEQKKQMIKEANNRVLNNQNPLDTYQVSIHYGVDAMSIAREYL